MLLAAVAGMLNPRRMEVWRGTMVMVSLERVEMFRSTMVMVSFERVEAVVVCLSVQRKQIVI